MKIYWKIISLSVSCVLLLAACIGQGNVSTSPSTTTSSPAVTQIPAQVVTPTVSKPIPVGAITGMPHASDGLPWWNNSTFYEIFVRSFFDSNGDGNGDIKGITQNLDYLSNLGVNGLWLTPIFPSPSYHGYDVTDYYSVNPQFGTMDDMKTLIDEAHKRGMRVILDMPFNHTSSEHPWFKKALDPKSPYHDWYIWSDKDPGTMNPWGGKAWHSSPTGTGYYYGGFWSGMPDLNYHNPAVVDEINNIAKYWLKDVGVDGFRLDAGLYMVEEGDKIADTPSNHTWFKNFRKYVKGIAPEALLLGELWTNDKTVSTYLNGDELDQAFDFDLANAVMTSANVGNADKVNNQLTFTLKNFPAGQYSTFLTNHDMDRVMTLLGQDPQKAKNAAAILLTLPGMPVIYYGEEIGMQGQRGSGDTDVQRRLPMQWTADKNAGFTTAAPWEAVHPAYNQYNVAAESADKTSLLSFYRDLVNLRNNHVALRTGDTYKLNSSNNAVYAVLRANKEEQVIVIVNLSSQAVDNVNFSLDSGPLSGSYHIVPVLGDGQFPDLTANASGGFDFYPSPPLATLPGNSRLVLQLQPIK